MSTYESNSQRIEAEQFDGADVTAITALAGPANVSFAGGILQVRLKDRWEDVFPGWWVRLNGKGVLGVVSAQAFADDWSGVAVPD